MFGLKKYLTIAAVTGVLTVSAYAYWQTRQNAALRAENGRLARNIEVLTMQAEQSRLAREVEAARAQAAQARNAELAEEIETILTGGIPDATLHPDLADLLNRRSMQPDD